MWAPGLIPRVALEGPGFDSQGGPIALALFMVNSFLRRRRRVHRRLAQAGIEQNAG